MQRGFLNLDQDLDSKNAWACNAMWLFSKSSFLKNLDPHVEPGLIDSWSRFGFLENQGMQPATWLFSQKVASSRIWVRMFRDSQRVYWQG